MKDLKKDSELLGKVGEIEVKVHRCSDGTELRDYEVAEDKSSSIGSKVHEKALKGDAKSHSVSSVYNSPEKSLNSKSSQLSKIRSRDQACLEKLL